MLFLCCFCLFDTLCGYCSWRIHSNSLPLDCFVCTTDLLRIHSATHCLLPGHFSHPYCDKLLTPSSESVFGLHAIGFLPAAIICIVCFFLSLFFFFFFFFSLVFLVSFFVFLLFPSCYLIFHFIHLFPYTFSFMFLLLIRLYHFSLIYPFLLWSRPWVVDVNDFLAFGLRRMSFGMMILLSGPRNKRYLYI
jgi:hypothetical protein